jgi:biotin carboxyl carrier protein
VIDVARVGDIWSLLDGDGACRRSYEVTFSEAGQTAAGSGRQLTVHVNGTPVIVEMPGTSRRTGRGARGSQGETRSGPAAVTAPMPGRVVQVLVKTGDQVSARQGLLVIEAMKMENELRAPHAGTVKEIRAGQGALVEAGAIVVVLE